MDKNNTFPGSVQFHLRQQSLWLLPQKAIYWPEKKTLILADVHLGKAGHFRKAGIPTPSAIHHDDLAELTHLIAVTQTAQVLILGDLFHSEHNREWQDFEHFLTRQKAISFTLIKGNHDILPEAAYEKENLLIAEESLVIPPFLFTHQPAFHLPQMAASLPQPDIKYQKFYNLCGHVHPGIGIQGRAGLNFKIPCFFFSKSVGILPAFGRFTGYINIKKNFQDCVFGIVELNKPNKKVLKI